MYFSSACENCVECPLTGGCTACDPGFILNVDGTCQSCPNVDGSENTCLECGSTTRGRFFDSGSCLCKNWVQRAK